MTLFIDPSARNLHVPPRPEPGQEPSRIGKLLVRVKTFLSRHMIIYEFCRKCGRRVRLIWTASDLLWLAVSDSQLPLCIRCFDDKAMRAGVLLRWVPQVYEKHWRQEDMAAPPSGGV